MQYGYRPHLYYLCLICILLIAPMGVVAQEGDGTLPATAVIDAPLDSCPRYYYLPLIHGADATGNVASIAAALPLVNDPPDINLDDQRLPLYPPALTRKVQNVPVITSTLVFSVATSLWEDPSPDPSGLDLYGPHSVIVSDSEVNERGAVKNVWIFDLESRQVQTSTSTIPNNISTEPTDIATAQDGTIIITDDVRRRIISAKMDQDGNLVELHSFYTSFYGSIDPEGVDLFERADGLYLVTADAVSHTIYTHYAGANGIFDGPCTPGDDSVQQFDAAQLGFLQPGGVYAIPDAVGTGVTYYLVGDPDRDHISVVYAKDGVAELVQKIDIGELDQYKKMAGIVVMENGQIVLVFRNVDNDSNPNENDGILAVIEPAS